MSSKFKKSREHQQKKNANITLPIEWKKPFAKDLMGKYQMKEYFDGWVVTKN